MAIVHLRLLGDLEIRNRNGETIDLSVKKVMALLAYLAVQPENQFQREQIAQLFWPNAMSKHCRHSLRQALADLRKYLPDFDDIFHVTYHAIDVVPGSIAVDVLDFTDATKRQDLESQDKACQLYQGRFLDGFTIHSEPFSIWQEEIALDLHQRYIQVVEFLAEHNLLRGNNLKAIELNNELVALDPIRESAHRCLMSLYARLGKYDEVEAQYAQCRELLQEKLRSEPEERTISCYQRIRQQFEA